MTSIRSSVTKDRLQSMDAERFEQFVADLWQRQGWETAVTSPSADGGIDVVATRNDTFPEKHVIQAKRYSEGNKVGGPDIQQYASLRQQEPGTDMVAVVTTSSFTSAASERADDLNVKLVDGDALVDLVKEYDARELVDQYTTQNTSFETTDLEQFNVPDDGNSTTQPDVVVEPEESSDQGITIADENTADMEFSQLDPGTAFGIPIEARENYNANSTVRDVAESKPRRSHQQSSPNQIHDLTDRTPTRTTTNTSPSPSSGTRSSRTDRSKQTASAPSPSKQEPNTTPSPSKQETKEPSGSNTGHVRTAAVSSRSTSGRTSPAGVQLADVARLVWGFLGVVFTFFFLFNLLNPI